MLLRKTITKRQKKERSRKKLGLILLFVGLVLISLSLFFAAFLEKPDRPISPLSKDQISINSKIEKGLKDKKISYISVETLKDLNYQILLDGKMQVVIDSNKDIEEQLSSLQLILTQLKIEGKSFKRLDFRYQKPVISF